MGQDPTCRSREPSHTDMMTSASNTRSRAVHLPILLALSLVSCLMLTPLGRTQSGRWISGVADGSAWFHGKLSKAQAEAKERNVPLVVCCVLEGEEASGRFQDTLSEDNLLSSLSAELILVLANDGDHEQKEVKVKGADGKRVKKSVCSAFGTDDCDAHKLQWDAVYKDYVMPDGGEWILPEVILVRPDGKIEERFRELDIIPLGPVVREIKTLQKVLGRGVSANDIANLRREVTMAQAMAKAKLWSDSWKSWSKVGKWAPSGPHAEAAKSGMELALKEMKLSLETQAKRLVPATLEDAYRRIRAMDFDDSPIEREVGKVLGAARRDPQLKPRLAEIDLILEAEGLLKDIEEALQAKNKGLAKRLLRKLASKKLSHTPAAEQAKERYKDL